MCVSLNPDWLQITLESEHTLSANAIPALGLFSPWFAILTFSIIPIFAFLDTLKSYGTPRMCILPCFDRVVSLRFCGLLSDLISFL